MRSSAVYIAIWLITATIAALLALLLDTAAFVDGHYLPVGNDSFYHARRILDAAIGERGFYQFDDMIHVPEGSWLNWPWGYDYLMAQALRVAMWIRPSTEPMAFLAYVPVAWVYVNFGLATLVTRRVRLAPAYAAIALFGFALLPLTQNLHGIGIIDHHYIELTFVLASLWAGLRFFAAANATSAISLGVILGIAPAFHNGLFILQIPVLACAFIIWLRGATPPPRDMLRLAGSLAAATLLVLLPSAPFQDRQFEFWTLSWFHLYVALGSAAVVAFLAWRPATGKNVAWMLAGGALAVVPLFAKLLTGAAFLGGDLILLEYIAEVRSPLARATDPDGLAWVARYYSGLFFIAPLFLLVFLARAFRESAPDRIYLAVFAVFGIALMMTQFRLHPFGSWTLVIASLVLAAELGERREVPTSVVSVITLAILAFTFQPPLRNQLFLTFAPGLSQDYAAARPLFTSLAAACAKQSGAVLSSTDDGHYIRYHTDCSVLTNNLLMTPFHEQKITEAERLLQMTPDEFLETAKHVDYVFVRMNHVFERGPDGIRPRPVAEVAASNAPLFSALTFSPDIPAGFRLIDELRVDDERDFAYARVFEVTRQE